jgi:hypothetical protein
MSLGGKYGPAPDIADLTVDAAAARLDTYDRAARASLASRGELPRAPILQVGDERLAALFAPRQLESLVRAPLGRVFGCDVEPAGEAAPERPDGPQTPGRKKPQTLGEM